MPDFNRERRLRTRSVAGTLALGETLAEMLPAPRLIVLSGGLGAGKTTLVKGIVAALGAAEAEEVLSPTFTLVHEYRGAKVTVFHLDLYRLESELELEELGWAEMADAPQALVLVEWGNRFPRVMARADGEIQIGPGDAENERLLLVRWRE